MVILGLMVMVLMFDDVKSVVPGGKGCLEAGRGSRTVGNR